MLHGAKPEVRLCVWLILRNHSFRLPFSSSIGALSKRLGVSVDIASETIHYLSNSNLFTRISNVRRSRVGRPTPEFDISSELITRFKHCAEHQHYLLINELLDLEVNKGTFHQNLKLGNRLLLIVMLLHSDKYGLIQMLGFSRISKLTGMGRDQFDSQLAKLRTNEYVLSVTPGVSSKKILGTRSSIYLLNITTDKFCCASYSLLICNSCVSFDVYQEISSFSFQVIKYLHLIYGIIENASEVRQHNSLSKSEYQYERIEKIVSVKNLNKSFRLFMETNLKRNLQRYIAEIVNLTALKFIFEEECLDDEVCNQWIKQLADILRPTFEYKKKSNVSSILLKVDLIDSSSVTCDDDENLMDTWDIDVFSAVLFKAFILPLIDELSLRVESIETHYNEKPLYGFIISQSKPVSYQSLIMLFPALSELKDKKIHFSQGKLMAV